MHINKLRVSRFRNISSPLELNFVPGITVVKAKNEGGKSTVRRAIDIALYGDPKSTKREVKDFKSWGSDDMYEISLEFTAGGEEFILERDYNGKVSALIRKGEDKKVSDKKKIAEVLTEYIGLPNEALFRNIVCFSAEELSQVKDTNDLTKRLEEKISGVEGVSVDDLLKKIQTELSRLNKGLKRHADSPGPIKVNQDKLAKLQERYREIENEINTGTENHIRFNELSGKIKKIREKLRIKKKAFEKCLEYKKANDDYIKAKEQFKYYNDTLEKRKKLSKKSKKLFEQAEKIKVSGLAVRKALDLIQPVLDEAEVIKNTQKEVELLKENIKKITGAIRDLETAQGELEKYTEVKGQDLQQSNRINNEINSLKLAGVNQGFKVDIKQLGDIEPEIVVDGIRQIWSPGEPVDIGAAAVITFPGVAEMRLTNKNSQAVDNIESERVKSQELSTILKRYGVNSFEELQYLNEQHKKAQQNVMMKKNTLQTLLGDKTVTDLEKDRIQKEELILKCRDRIKAALPEILEAIAEIEPIPNFSEEEAISILGEKKKAYEMLRDKLVNKFNEFNTPYQQIVGQLNNIAPEEELEAGKKEWAVKVYITETALEQTKMPDIDIEQITQLEDDINRLENELADIEKDKDLLEIKISTEKYGVEDLENLQDKIDQTRKTLNFYQEKAEVLSKVKVLFEEARNNTLANMAVAIGSRMADYVKELTEGRYHQVEVSPDGLAIHVYSDEKGDCVNIDKEMSTGTRDQIYLAARLAMVPAAANGRKPPLILDDSLVYFDSNRRKKAFEILRDLSKEHQIIIFSCHNYYDSLADNVIDLCSDYSNL